jgi:hypothetical protein
MNTFVNNAFRRVSLARLLALSGFVAAAALGMAGQARAEVVWSVGIHEPGVNVRVSNAPRLPVVVAQAPVVLVPRQVVMQPAPVVVYPATVVQQRVVYAEPRHHHPRGKAHGYWRSHGHGHDHYAHGYGHR